MKKLIATLTLLLTFTIGASAQQTKPLTSEEAGKSDTAKLSALVHLTAEQQPLFENLFAVRNQHLNDEELSVGRKEELVSVMNSKIKSILTEEQYIKLNGNTELLKSLTGENIVKIPVKKQ